jgi:hypothetical protein
MNRLALPRRGRPPAPPDRVRGDIIGLRCRSAFTRALEGLAVQEDCSLTEFYEMALREAARTRGFELPTR